MKQILETWAAVGEAGFHNSNSRDHGKNHGLKAAPGGLIFLQLVDPQA